MSSGKIINSFQKGLNNQFDLNINKLEILFQEIVEIHFLLKNGLELSNNKKLDYCKVERNLMIEFLKELIKKY